MYGTNEPFHRKENHEIGEKPCGCQGGRKVVGWIGSLELVDADYCLWDGLAMRSYHVALGTMSSHL